MVLADGGRSVWAKATSFCGTMEGLVPGSGSCSRVIGAGALAESLVQALVVWTPEQAAQDRRQPGEKVESGPDR